MTITEYHAINSEGETIKKYIVSHNNLKAAAEKLKRDFKNNGVFLKLKKYQDLKI